VIDGLRLPFSFNTLNFFPLAFHGSAFTTTSSKFQTRQSAARESLKNSSSAAVSVEGAIKRKVRWVHPWIVGNVVVNPATRTRKGSGGMLSVASAGRSQNVRV